MKPSARVACLTAALGLLAAPPASAAERHSISIAPGRLGDAVIALARQTGTSIGMTDPALANLPVPALSGRMSVDDALSRLLRAAPARARRIDGASWRIASAPRRRAPVAPAPSAPRSPAPAAPEEPAADIVVTASKRDTPLLRYAGGIDMVANNSLSTGEAAGGGATLLQRAAALSSTHVGSGRNKLFIRAIADSGFAGPTQATTGQYFSDMRLNYAAPDPDLRLFDVGGVEVLEGPQGTLYGAGSLGGILRIVPHAPNLGEWSGQAGAGVSAVEHGRMGGDLSAVLNIPIAPEKLALRVVGYGVDDGGYIDDRLRGLRDVNDTRTRGARAALRFAPDDAWTIDLTGLYQRIEGDDAQYAARSVGELARESTVAQLYFSDYWLTNLRIERQWDNLRLVSSTGHVRQVLTESYDATQPGGSSGLFRQRNSIALFTTENRLVRDLDNGLGWILGMSFLESTSNIRRSLAYFGDPPETQTILPGVAMIGKGIPAPATGVQNKVREATLFGEASFEPWRGLIATFGGRLTHSRLWGKALDPVDALSDFDLAKAEAQADRTETIFLPSFSLLTDALPGMTIFARYQQGFRPGGLAVDDQRVRRFRNDRIGTAELGVRSGQPGRDPIAVSASFAYTDWRNIQADVTDRRGLPTTANIGDGRIYTLEGRVVLRGARGLTIDASAIYNDSRLVRPTLLVQALNFEGQSLSLPNVASLGGRVAVDYRQPVGDTAQIHFNGSARYVGKSRLGVGPTLGGEQGDYIDTALSASWSRGPLELSLSLANIFDSNGNRFALGTPFDLGADYYTPVRPRTVRMGLDFAF